MFMKIRSLIIPRSNDLCDKANLRSESKFLACPEGAVGRSFGSLLSTTLPLIN
jgi:hypothetical protein